MMHRPEPQMGHYMQPSMQQARQEMKRLHNSISQSKMPAPPSSRILTDVPCKVCRDNSSGKHYGIYACDGCAGFFKRSIRRNRQYACKAKAEGGCMVDKTHRNQCRSCRLAKCIQAGMNRDAVQHERGPRNATLRRQMQLYYGKDADMMPSIVPPSNAALDLVLPKSSPEPRVTVPPPPAAHHIVHSIYRPMEISKMTGFVPSMTPLVGLPYVIDDVMYRHRTVQAELAAQILFSNVRWVKELNANSGLCMDDQLTILEASWSELFLLSASQITDPHKQVDPSHLFMPGTEEYTQLQPHASSFRDIVASFRALKLDAEEYRCVKTIVLYKAGLDCESNSSSRSSDGSVSPGGSRLKDTAMVLKLRESAQTALSVKMQAITPAGAMRYNHLTLVLVPLLRGVRAYIIDGFFFKKHTGDASIEKVISDVYLNRTSGHRL